MFFPGALRTLVLESHIPRLQPAALPWLCDLTQVALSDLSLPVCRKGGEPLRSFPALRFCVPNCFKRRVIPTAYPQWDISSGCRCNLWSPPSLTEGWGLSLGPQPLPGSVGSVQQPSSLPKARASHPPLPPSLQRWLDLMETPVDVWPRPLTEHRRHHWPGAHR